MNHECMDCNHTWKPTGLFLCPQCGSPNFIGTATPKVVTVYVAELASYVKKVKKWIPKEDT